MTQCMKFLIYKHFYALSWFLFGFNDTKYFKPKYFYHDNNMNYLAHCAVDGGSMANVRSITENFQQPITIYNFNICCELGFSNLWQ